LWFKYLLVDLNSATIDTSIIHDLTKRYEHLLSSFVSNKIELVSTDSVCLEVALENYKNNWDLNQYMILAWVNYESYDENWNTILRNVKKMECLKFISNLLENNLIDENNYSFLVRYKNYFKKNELDINTLNSFVWSSYRALFEIK
jgi:hypothetical protein